MAKYKTPKLFLAAALMTLNGLHIESTYSINKYLLLFLLLLI